MKSPQAVVSNDMAYLDLFRPPEGEQILCGVLMTHDLSAALTDEVLPRLCGIEAPDVRRRRAETRSVFTTDADAGSDWMLVVACADRIGPIPAMPGLRIAGVEGRRMHAKCALLVFGSPGSWKVTTVRAVVTSANITESGLRRNREVLLCDEVTRKQRKSSLVDSVLKLLGSLTPLRAREELGLTEVESAIIKTTRDLAQGLVQKSAEPLALRQTLIAREPLLRSVKGPAKRLIVVSPPFAGGGGGAVHQISHLLSPQTQVDLYIGAPNRGVDGSDEVPVFSPGVLRSLREHADPERVRLHLVAETAKFDSGETRSRPLHAKLLAVLDGSDMSTVLVGSANFTEAGLSGANRELMAEVRMPTHEVLQFVDDLDATRYEGHTREPTMDGERSMVKVRPRLRPQFTIGAGQDPMAAEWSGLLTLDLSFKERPVAVIVCGQRHLVTGRQVSLNVRLHEADSTVELEWPDGGITRHAVWVTAPVGDAKFWDRIGTPDPDLNPDREFLNALFDLRRVGALAKVGKRAGGAPALPSTGGFRIPLAQRLVVLVRHRRKLVSELGLEELESRLSAFFDDPIELEVARSVLRSQLAEVPEGGDPLIAELCRSLVHVKAGGDAE